MGQDFSAKDFRTWGGTVLAAAELSLNKSPKTIKEKRKNITKCVKNVAKKLGNTPSVARNSYIDPRILSSYLENDKLYETRQKLVGIKQKPYFGLEENITLTVLKTQNL